LEFLEGGCAFLGMESVNATFLTGSSTDVCADDGCDAQEILNNEVAKQEKRKGFNMCENFEDSKKNDFI
jgi:hypothetical protein